MGKQYLKKDSIECLSAEIISKKIVPSGLIEEKGIRFTKYKCSRSASAEIKKECTKKKSILEKAANMCLGDKIEGDKIFFQVNKLAALSFKKIAHTGRHNSQQVLTKVLTYAEIELPYYTTPASKLTQLKKIT